MSGTLLRNALLYLRGTVTRLLLIQSIVSLWTDPFLLVSFIQFRSNSDPSVCLTCFAETLHTIDDTDLKDLWMLELSASQEVSLTELLRSKEWRNEKTRQPICQVVEALGLELSRDVVFAMMYSPF